jgi:hypothetical protein
MLGMGFIMRFSSDSKNSSEYYILFFYIFEITPSSFSPFYFYIYFYLIFLKILKLNLEPTFNWDSTLIFPSGPNSSTNFFTITNPKPIPKLIKNQ